MGKTQRGKGTKIMAMADRAGLPVAIYLESDSPQSASQGYEVTLVEKTLASRFIAVEPERLIGNRAYGSDLLDEKLREQGIEMIAPYRRNRVKPKTQDGRKFVNGPFTNPVIGLPCAGSRKCACHAAFNPIGSMEGLESGDTSLEAKYGAPALDWFAYASIQLIA